MTPRRRATDQQPAIVRYWPIVACLVGWLLAGVIAFVHLEDDNRATRGRMDFHWGKEW